MTSQVLSSAAGHYRWVILGVATFAQSSACFFVQGIGSIGIFLQRDLQLSTAQIGLLVSAAQFTPLIGLILAGELLDRYGERWVVGVGTLVVGLALIGGSFAPGYMSLLLVLLIVGAGYSTAQPGGSKSVASWFARSERGLALGIRQAGLPLGGALASASLPFLVNREGWRAALVAGGLVALFGAVVFIAFYRTPESTVPIKKSRDSPVQSGSRSRLKMIRDPSMVNTVMSGTSLMTVQYGILLFSGFYLHESVSMGIEKTAVFLLTAQCAGVVGRIALAAWSDRCDTGRLFPVLLCLSAVILGLVLLMTVPLRSDFVVAPLFAWLGFFGFGWYGPWVAYVADSAPQGRAGFTLGFAMTVNQIAVVLVSPALGLIRDITRGYLAGWCVLTALSLVALIAIVWRRRAPRSRYV